MTQVSETDYSIDNSHLGSSLHPAIIQPAGARSQAAANFWEPAASPVTGAHMSSLPGGLSLPHGWSESDLDSDIDDAAEAASAP